MKRIVLTLLGIGTAVAVLALGKLHAVLYDYDYSGSSRLGWSLAFVLALIVSAYGVGLPDLPRDRRARLVLGAAASAIAVSIISALQLFIGDALLPRFVVFGSAAVLVPWYVGCSTICGNGTSRAEQRARVVVVGDSSEGKRLGEELLHHSERPACLVDVVELDDSMLDLHNDVLIADRVIADHASVLVLSREAQVNEGVISEAAYVHSAGVRVRSLLSFYEEWLGRIPIVELERMSLMFDIGEIHRRHYLRLKRLLDVVVGVLGTLAFAILVPVIVVGNLIGNRGPLLYYQERIGKRGHRFQLIKFRTMRSTGAMPTNEWATPDDPRITPFGRFLRRTHLDELPQVVNVLRGELSVVGPRPEQPHYVRWLVDRIPYYDMRHMVRPGITGWAQVNYGYAGDERDALEKLQYDFYYLRHQSLLLDVRIILRTIRSVMGFAGR